MQLTARGRDASSLEEHICRYRASNDSGHDLRNFWLCPGVTPSCRRVKGRAAQQRLDKGTNYVLLRDGGEID
jgi:hypothetical protein